MAASPSTTSSASVPVVSEHVVTSAGSDIVTVVMALVVVAGWILLMAIALKHLAVGMRARKWGAIAVAAVGFVLLFLFGEVSVFALGAHLSDSFISIRPTL